MIELQMRCSLWFWYARAQVGDSVVEARAWTRSGAEQAVLAEITRSLVDVSREEQYPTSSRGWWRVGWAGLGAVGVVLVLGLVGLIA